MPIEIESILNDFIDAAEAHEKATADGDYKTANKQYAILKKIYKKFDKNRLVAKNALEVLFKQDSVSVKIWASSHALSLNILTGDAEKILKHFSEDQNIGILRLDAEMTLKEWKKKSNLKL